MATVRIQLRRGTEQEWITADAIGAGVVLAPGETGIETDTNRFKFGNGVDQWGELLYANASNTGNTLDDYILTSSRGNPSGVASLDSSGLVPAAQLPASVKVTVNSVANQAARLALTAEAGDIAIQTDTGTTFVLSSSPASTDANWKALTNTAAITAAIAAHEADTTNVHGIADTSILVTTTGTQTLTNKTITSPSGLVKADVGLANVDNTSDANKPVSNATQTALDTKASNTDLSTHASDTTLIHGIDDTAELATKAFAASLLTGATKTNITITGDKTGLTITAENGVADSTTDNLTEGTNNLYFTNQRAAAAISADLGNIGDEIDLKAPLASPALTGTPLAPTATAGTNNTQIATTAYTDAAIAALVDTAPGALNTLNEIAAAINDDANFSGTIVGMVSDVAGNLTTHSGASSAHGVSGFIVGTTSTQTLSGKTISGTDNTFSNIPQSAITDLESDLDLKANLASPQFTGTVLGITKSMVGLGDVNNTSDASKPISTLTQNALDAKADAADLGAKANTASPTFTGTVVLPSTTSIGLVDSTEIGYVNGVTSSIQDQIDAKISSATASSTYAPKDAPTFTGTVSLPSTTSIGSVTASEIGILSGVTASTSEINKLAGLVASTTELNILDGITASTLELNTLDGITASTAELNTLDGVTATFTEINTLSGITATTAELNVLDGITASVAELNVLDGITATAAELNVLDGITASVAELNVLDGITSSTAELNILDGVLTSASELNILDGAGLTTIELNYLMGATSSIQTQLNAKQATVANVTDTEIGYLDGVTSSIQTQINNKQAVVANVSDVEIGYLDGVTSAIQTQLDAKLAASTASSTYQPIVSGVSDTEIAYLDGVTSAIQTQINDKLATATASSTYAPLASPTFTGTVSGVTKTHVGLSDVDNTADASKPVSTATQTALDLKLASATAATTYAPLASPTFTGTVTLAGAPTSDLHAATKLYVDNVSAGLNFHQPARVATTGNITLSGTQTIDGVAVIAGDRVLVKDQTTQTQNGLYVVAEGAWSRALDADNTPDAELKGGDFTLVLEGTIGSGYGYVCSNTSAITIGTTNVTYAAFNAAKGVVAGNGLSEATPGILSIDTAVTQARVANVSDTEIGYLDGVTSAIQTQLDTKETRYYTFVTDATTARTVTASTDEGKTLKFTSSSPITITIPTAANDAGWAVGDYVEIIQYGSGQITVAGDTGVTVNATDSQKKTRVQFSSLTLIKVAANEWLLTGDTTA